MVFKLLGWLVLCCVCVGWLVVLELVLFTLLLFRFVAFVLVFVTVVVFCIYGWLCLFLVGDCVAIYLFVG